MTDERPYGKLPDLLEEVEYLIGDRPLRSMFLDELQRLQKVRDVMMDANETMKMIDTALEMQIHIDRGSTRSNLAAPCVCIVKCWRLLEEEDAVRKMSLMLINMAAKDPVTALGLVGEFT